MAGSGGRAFEYISDIYTYTEQTTLDSWKFPENHNFQTCFEHSEVTRKWVYEAHISKWSVDRYQELGLGRGLHSFNLGLGKCLYCTVHVEIGTVRKDTQTPCGYPK